MEYDPQRPGVRTVATLPATIFLAGGPSPARQAVHYPAIVIAEPFDRVVLAPNGQIGDRGTAEFCAGPSREEQHLVVSWAGPQAKPAGGPLPRPVNVDVLELKQANKVLHVSAKLQDPDGQSVMRGVGATLFSSKENAAERTGEPHALAGEEESIALPVELLSQFSVGSPADGSLCCPTSAVMVLRFWGAAIDVLDFARRAFDHRHLRHGNWSLTAAVMSSFGVRAWVQKHTSLAQLHEVVRAGRPVIVSISYGRAELPGSPIPESSGHLLVVRGFTGRGDVLVCDPAGRTSADGEVAYDRVAFTQVWLGHGGIAIHAVPEKGQS